jgi:hypothetical protein
VITANESSRLAELKATRNVRAHNAGIANEIYVRKSGQLARAKAGEPLSMPTARLTRAVLRLQPPPNPRLQLTGASAHGSARGRPPVADSRP